MDDHPGCWNTPRAGHYMVKNGVKVVELDGELCGVIFLESYEDKSTKECQFDLRAQEPRCDGCLK